MNVIWIVADTFRRDHVGAYGDKVIRTPSLDALAAKSMRFDRHYIGGFPTMPTRADHATGRFTMSFMGWEDLPEDATTLAQLLADAGYHTAAVVDTPFYWRHGMNYDRGFQTFFTVQGQEGSATRVQAIGNHESRDVVAWWRKESDHNVAQTMIKAGDWLERHYKEDFFLYVDTWDPHEPWDAPPYYTELYMPDYDGEVVQPIYAHWQDDPDFSAAKVEKAAATYKGEVTMVDTWVGHLLRKVENMGLSDKTMIVFTSDHGFYFGEHGGLFGKMTFAKRPDGRLYRHGDPDSKWEFSPLYEELTTIPLVIHHPDHAPGNYTGLTSVVDVMPTVLDTLEQPLPDILDGRSLMPAIRGDSMAGREFNVSTIPFANPGDDVRSVDNIRRSLASGIITTVTSDDWAFLHSVDPGLSELYDLRADPKQQNNVINENEATARMLHGFLVRFMKETEVPAHLLEPRSELRM